MRRPYVNRVTVLLLIYLFYLGCLTLTPFDFSVAAIAHGPWVYGSRSIPDVVLNILGFVPFGAILYFLTRPNSKNLISKWGLTTGTAAILSLSIEIGQMFLPSRVPSPSDLLGNTLGGALGFWLAHHLRQGLWIPHLQRYRRTLVLSGLTLYLGALIGFFIWTATAKKLEGWDPSYRFLIGNEATLDGTWLGKIFFLALYDRVLTADEIESQFHAGRRFKRELHLAGRPIALYAFQEGRGTRLHDLSRIAPALDLEIADPQKTNWLPRGGLELTGATIVRSRDRPQKVYQRFTATDAFSVATWIEPKYTLHAAARIVSLSLNSKSRNFTLAQEKSEIHFRVRNRVAGPNGDRVNLRTKGLGLLPQPTHVVAIYGRGTEQVYVNGVLIQSIATHDALTVIAQILNFDVTSRWQRGLLAMLLVGPVGGCWTLMRIADEKR